MNWLKNRKKMQYIQNFMAWSYFIISLKLGLLDGSLSQHFFMSLVKHSGVFFGILGLKSLFKTSIETWSPDKSEIKNIITFKRRLSWCDLPQNYSITENVSLLTVFLTGDNLWSHPLIGSDFSRHIVVQSLSPSEVS